MEIFRIENLSFAYPSKEEKVLDDISLNIKKGEFVCLLGRSGCGKTTLLRLLKPVLAPAGKAGGSIYFMDKLISDLSQREAAQKIGFVSQSPESQIVTDKVWHELAFGLENLGYSTPEIRKRVSEMASFFGIGDWFYKNTSELSGGEKQLLNLAACLVMQPEVLILDEPTSRLDPIAAGNFLNTLKRINREMGITVIISEHRTEEVFPISDRVLVMENKRIIADASLFEIGKILKEQNIGIYASLPAPARIFGAMESFLAPLPVTVKKGRECLLEYKDKIKLKPVIKKEYQRSQNTKVELKDVWFRRGKEDDDILKGMSLCVKEGELFAILGANGSGKSTALSLVSGINTPYRGKVLINGIKLKDIKNLYGTMLGVLPQNPQEIFVKNTLEDDFLDVFSGNAVKEENPAIFPGSVQSAQESPDVFPAGGQSAQESPGISPGGAPGPNQAAEKIKRLAKEFGISDLLNSHPFDLSGGEQQKAALLKVLLKNPEILLLDEPTKGFDAQFKKTFAGILNRLKKAGITIIMVSHDMEFCAENADRCALLFDGKIMAEGAPDEFFAGNYFYTTAASRMSRGIIDGAVTADDVILALGGKVSGLAAEKEAKEETKTAKYSKESEKENIAKDGKEAEETHIAKDGKEAEETQIAKDGKEAEEEKTAKQAKTEEKAQNFRRRRYIFGTLSALLFAVLCFLQIKMQNAAINGVPLYTVQILSAAALAFGFVLFFGKERKAAVKINPLISQEKNKFNIKNLIAALLVLILMIATVFCGVYYFGDRKYYFISLLVIFEGLLPVFFGFEKRKPAARELVMLSVLCALAVAGRAALSMLPQFKPSLALIIITGACFGGAKGFLAGALCGFVSNFFFGQGPWTPWQMLAFGLCGYLSGLLFESELLKKTRTALSIFGFLATILVYGVIVNVGSLLIYQPYPTAWALLSSVLMGLPFDLLHAASTVFFLWLLSDTMIEKIERVKIKYDM